MTNRWTITEKTIGGLEIIYGLFLLFMTIYGATTIWDLALKYPETISSDHALINIAKKFHNQIILSILTTYSGTLLLLNKRIGWTISLATSLLNGIWIIISVMTLRKDQTTYATGVILATIVSLTFLATFILLLSKPLRDKYVVSTRTWPTIAVIVIVMLTDNILFKNF